jgi:hypothetical protein
MNVASSGNHDLQLRVATTVTGRTLHVEIDNVDVTGAVTLPNTGAYTTFNTVTVPGIPLSAGTRVMRVVMDGTMNVDWFAWTAVACTPESNTVFCARLGKNCGSVSDTDNCGASRTVSSCGTCTSPQSCGGGGIANVCGAPSGQTAFGGTAWAIPGTVQAENYDVGGEGVAYHDTTTGNAGGQHRSDDVDIAGTSCGTGCLNIGFGVAGEWLEYTVNVASTGNYNLQLRVSTNASVRTTHIDVDNVNVTGSVSLPVTGSWNTYTTVTVPNVPLTAGTRVIRVTMDSVFNIDWFSFSAAP